MLRILYYLCTKSGKISAKKGGGLTLRHGRTLRYRNAHSRTCVPVYLYVTYGRLFVSVDRAATTRPSSSADLSRTSQQE